MEKEAILKEVLKYMNMPLFKADEVLKEQVLKNYQSLEEHVTVKAIKKPFKIRKEDQTVFFEDTSFEITSTNLSRFLANCGSVYLVAITLGNEVEKLVAEAQNVNVLDALMLNACASVKIEEACEALETEIKQAIKEDECLNGRYNPGYGDVPLKIQGELLNLMDAQNQIGVTATKAGMLVPHKSMVAFIGVSSES